MDKVPVQRRLRAVAVDTPAPPLPDVSWLCEVGPRRPGEFHEPIALGSAAECQLKRAADLAAQSPSLAGRLLLEAALLRHDLTRIGRSDDEVVLDEAARAARVSRRMSAADADYLRALRAPARREPGGAVTVAIRLLARLDDIDVVVALGGDAQQAARWEAAALMQGRTMLEWGLLVALRGAG
jgi:hypothetical protein